VPPPHCAWEHAPGFITWFETARAVLGTPRPAFRVIPRRGGLGRPLLFWSCGMLAGGAGAAGWRILRMAGAGRLDDFDAVQIAVPIAMGFAIAVVASLVVLFVAAGVVHLLLTLQGAGRHGFEATFRTVAYAHGSGAMFGLIPFIGSTIGFVWALAVAVPGLAEMQETNTGTAALAVLAPAVSCCGVTILVLALGLAAVLG
jgi:hypothetical protein